MADESAAQSPRDGGDGLPVSAPWTVSQDDIEKVLADEVSIYLLHWPKARLIKSEWNWAEYERGFLFWKQRDKIYVCADGVVVLVSKSGTRRTEDDNPNA